MRKNVSEKTIRLSLLAILFALVLILQIWGSGIHIIGATSISLVLVPIALGGMLLGPGAGAFLGFVFGGITFLSGLFGVDPFTQTLIQFQPLYTCLLCFLKGTAAGFVSGIVWKVFEKKNKTLAAFLSAASTPIVNTGIFALMSLGLRETMQAQFMEEGVGFFMFLFFTLIGVNFLVEFAVNMITATALARIVETVRNKLSQS